MRRHTTCSKFAQVTLVSPRRHARRPVDEGESEGTLSRASTQSGANARAPLPHMQRALRGPCHASSDHAQSYRC
eukprot:364668-Chlamydomonas_euryale.AAC.6